jgi:hypothetical protein
MATMRNILLDPWVLLVVMALIALFFIGRSTLQIKQIDRLRARLKRSQTQIQTELTQLVEVGNE